MLSQGIRKWVASSGVLISDDVLFCIISMEFLGQPFELIVGNIHDVHDGMICKLVKCVLNSSIILLMNRN